MEIGSPLQGLVAAHRHGCLLDRLDAEAVTPLLAPTCEHVAAVLRAHALEEPVDALAAPIVRLVRPLHNV